MRILYIVTAFPRFPGDVITPWMSETIDRLRSSGTDVEVLAPSYRGLGDQEIDGTRIHRFRYAPAALETLTHDQTTPDRLRERPYYAALLPGYLLAGALAASRLARTGRFDVLHAFWPLPHSLLALAARATSAVPVVSTFFGVELTWMRRQLPFLASTARWIVRRSDAVTVISKATATALEGVERRSDIRTIPFGAASSREEGTAPSSVRSDASSSGDLPLDRSFRLLFVGRLVERKGVLYLLRAFARIDDVGLVLTVVGDGPLLQPLRDAAKEMGIDDRVQFTGTITASDLDAEFDRCDAFILPAVEDEKGDVEGLGVVLLEALAHGRPVIASDSGGIPDIVEDGRTGLLVPPGDVEALARAIIRLRDDPALARDLVVAGQVHVERTFSWHTIVAELNDLYADVAHRARDGRHVIDAGR